MGYNHHITEKLFELAKEVAPVRGARIVSAVVSKQGRIIALGCNSYKTHPRAIELQGTDKKPCLHAEMNAIFQAQNTYGSLKGFDIYVIRAKNSGYGIHGSQILNTWIYGTSKPCKACEKLINEVGIKNVYCKATKE